VVVLAATVVADGPRVVLVVAGIVVPMIVVDGSEGAAVVVVEAGGLVPAVVAASCGGVVARDGDTGLAVVEVLDGWEVACAIEVVVVVAGSAAAVKVVASTDVLVVVVPSSAPVTESSAGGWPRTTSSKRASRKNKASTYRPTFSRYSVDSPPHHRRSRVRRPVVWS